MTNTTEPTAEPPAPRRLRWLLIGGGALAVVILAVAVTISVLPGDATPTADSSHGPRSTPTGEAADREDSTSTPSPTPGDQQETTPRDATSPETQNPTSNTSPNGAAAPVIPAIPRDASALSALVAGFPGNIPLAQNSTVSNSSIATSGNTVQATLEAVTTTEPADVAAFYNAIFSALGLPGSELQAVAGSNAIAFTQGDESITLTITPTSSGSTYSLFGVLNAAT